MENKEIKPGKYRHFKGGEYEVLFTARHSETLEEMVVYKALYGEGGIWAVSYTHLIFSLYRKIQEKSDFG